MTKKFEGFIVDGPAAGHWVSQACARLLVPIAVKDDGGKTLPVDRLVYEWNDGSWRLAGIR